MILLSTQASGFLTSFRSVDQGGVLTNVTDRFYDYEYTTDLFDEVVQAASQNGAEFEEYIVRSSVDIFCLFFQGRANLEEQG